MYSKTQNGLALARERPACSGGPRSPSVTTSPGSTSRRYLGADDVERAGLAGDAVARPARPSPSPAGGVDRRRSRAAAARAGRGRRRRGPWSWRRSRRRPCSRGSTSATASSTRSAGWVAISAAMISESEVELNVTPRSDSSSCSSTALIRLPLWASATSRREPLVPSRALHRLGVLPGVRAGRRVAHVADRQLAGERAQVVLAEDLADEARARGG